MNCCDKPYGCAYEHCSRRIAREEEQRFQKSIEESVTRVKARIAQTQALVAKLNALQQHLQSVSLQRQHMIDLYNYPLNSDLIKGYDRVIIALQDAIDVAK